MKRRDFFKFLTVTPLGVKALLDQAIEEQSETSIEDDEPNDEMIGSPGWTSSGSFLPFYHGTMSASSLIDAESINDDARTYKLYSPGDDPRNSLGIPISEEDEIIVTGLFIKGDE